MKQKIMSDAVLRGVICGALLLLFSPPCGAVADDVTQEKPDFSTGDSSMLIPSGKSGGSPVSAEGQDVDKLLYTLNETLQENRKIRQSMRDLQKAFETVTLEKSDVMGQMRKVEQLAIQRNSETDQRIKELTDQLSATKKDLETMQEDYQDLLGEKNNLEKSLDKLRSDQEKKEELLAQSILAEERDQIVERMKINEESVEKALSSEATLNRENLDLKTKLIQAHFEFGNLFYDLGRYHEAKTQYEYVLQWDPDHARAHHNLAVIYDYVFHQLPEAKDHYQRYMNLKPPSEEAREVRMRLWDISQLTKVTPEQPLKQDFKQYRKMPPS